jgi:hypothetical protein
MWLFTRKTKHYITKLGFVSLHPSPPPCAPGSLGRRMGLGMEFSHPRPFIYMYILNLHQPLWPRKLRELTVSEHMDVLGGLWFRRGLGACTHPSPLVLHISSIWLFLSHILYNKTVIVSILLSWLVWVILENIEGWGREVTGVGDGCWTGQKHRLSEDLISGW